MNGEAFPLLFMRLLKTLFFQWEFPVLQCAYKSPLLHYYYCYFIIVIIISIIIAPLMFLTSDIQTHGGSIGAVALKWLMLSA